MIVDAAGEPAMDSSTLSRLWVDLPGNVSIDAGHAVQVQRDIERARLGAIGHRPPALEAGMAGTELDLDVFLWDFLRTVGYLTRYRVDVENVLVAQIESAEKLVRLAIDAPKDAQFSHHEQILLAIAVDEHLFEVLVHIHRLAGNELVVPDNLASVGVERQCGARVEGVPVGAAANPGPGFRLCHAPVNELRIGIVAPRDPGIAASPKQQRQIIPGVTTALAGPGDRVSAPELHSRFRIVRGDEAAIFGVVPTSREVDSL